MEDGDDSISYRSEYEESDEPKRRYDDLLRGGEKVVRVLEVIAVMMTIVTKGQYQRKHNIP